MEDKKPISHFVAGTILAALVIIYSIIINFLGVMTPSAGWVSYAIIFVGLIVFVNMYGNAKNNFVSFGELFGYGFKATAILTLLVIVFLIIFNLVFPEFKEKAFDIARKQMEEKNNLSDADIDKALELGRKFFWVGIIAGTLLFYLIFGAIASLIGAAITKKKPFNPLDQLS